MGFLDKLKDINQMRKQAKAMEGQLAGETVSGKSSGGKIVLTIDGNQNVVASCTTASNWAGDNCAKQLVCR